MILYVIVFIALTIGAVFVGKLVRMRIADVKAAKAARIVRMTPAIPETPADFARPLDFEGTED